MVRNRLGASDLTISHQRVSTCDLTLGVVETFTYLKSPSLTGASWRPGLRYEHACCGGPEARKSWRSSAETGEQHLKPLQK